MADMKKYVQNTYGFLGLGQCGGNQVSLYRNYGVKTFFINSCQEDLASLGTDIHAYHIPDAEGCHKNRLVSQPYT